MGTPDSEPPKYEVIEGVAKLNGTESWRAEIAMLRPQKPDARYTGHPGYINIRGPSRLARDTADSDGRKLLEAVKSGGMSEARKLQRTLNNEAIEESRRS